MPRNNAVPVEQEKLNILYVFFIDAEPHFGFESDDADATSVMADLKAGLILPDDHDYQVRPHWDCTREDLERLKLVYEMKGHLFAFAQLAGRIRAGQSGLYAPGAPLPPPPGGPRRH